MRLAGLGEIPDRLTRLAGLPHTAAGVEVGPGLSGLLQGRFGLAQGGGPIRQADAHDGGSGEGRLGVQEGGRSAPAGRRGALGRCSRVRVAGSGRAVSRAQVGVRGVDQSRRRSSMAWGRSSATVHTWVDSRARDMAT